MSNDIRSALINAGLTSQDEMDSKLESFATKEKNFNFTKKRIESKKFINQFSLNRYGVRLQYPTWIVKNTVEKHKTCKCGFCGDDLTSKSEISFMIDDVWMKFKSTKESDVVSFISGNETWRLRHFDKFVTIASGEYVPYKIEKLGITINMCTNCLFYYVSNRFYPNHKNTQHVRNKTKK